MQDEKHFVLSTSEADLSGLERPTGILNSSYREKETIERITIKQKLIGILIFTHFLTFLP